MTPLIIAVVSLLAFDSFDYFGSNDDSPAPKRRQPRLVLVSVQCYPTIKEHRHVCLWSSGFP